MTKTSFDYQHHPMTGKIRRRSRDGRRKSRYRGGGGKNESESVTITEREHIEELMPFQSEIRTMMIAQS
jgi:hypothetical protein